MESTRYALGTSQAEAERLEFQSQLLQPATERLLREAGLRSGMRVLDIGTGTGEVALLAGEIVGQAGHVLGIDRNESIINLARQKIERGLKANWIEFRPISFDDFSGDQKFDLIVGRFVLAFQSKPADFLRKASGHIKSGGTIAFLEPGASLSDNTRSSPVVPLWDKTVNQVVEAFWSGGVHPDQGLRLTETFFNAGLAEPTLFRDPIVGSANASQIIRWVCLTMQSLLPVIEKMDGVTVADLEIQTLEQRLRDAASAAHSQLTFFSATGAIVRMI